MVEKIMTAKVYKTALLALLSILLYIPSTMASFSNESLRYVVTYKWGLIHKEAGDATLSLRNSGSDYLITLTARSRPWADHIFSVRDTLRATVSRNGLKPKHYTKIAHEGGKYARDEIKFTYSGRNVFGDVVKHRVKKGKTTVKTNRLAAVGSAYDMLSIFYYLRSIDYSRLQRGQVIKSSIFSGSQTETITIRSLGVEKVKMRDKSVREAYHIKFKFTRDGKKKSSDDMDTWISTDARHIPLVLVGSLPVGQVHCYFVG